MIQQKISKQTNKSPDCIKIILHLGSFLAPELYY